MSSKKSRVKETRKIRSRTPLPGKSGSGPRVAAGLGARAVCSVVILKESGRLLGRTRLPGLPCPQEFGFQTALLANAVFFFLLPGLSFVMLPPRDDFAFHAA